MIIDHAIQMLSRRVRANPGDLESAHGYRSALSRLARTSPQEAYPRLADLEGALCSPRSVVIDLESEMKREPPTSWLRVTTDGRRPLLPPRAPQGDLEEAWQADGIACWISHGIVLLETGDRRLEARDPKTGSVLWSVPSIAPARGSLDDDERAESLPWAVVPWGAVEVCARFQAALLYERVGRNQRREVSGRGGGEVELTLQVVLPKGGCWPRGGHEAPEFLIECVEPGQTLCDTDLSFDSYNDTLETLALDPASRSIGLSCGLSRHDLESDWTILRVGGGDHVPGHLGPAGWTPEDSQDPEPFSLDLGLRHTRAGERLLEVEGEAVPVQSFPAAGMFFAQVASETLVAFESA